ncbi:MAG: hypothetical protein GXY44_03285 [Phycisphaerales bacterium]|nr:hypothetical protein [Phycisphaerales bacterium]
MRAQPIMWRRGTLYPCVCAILGGVCWSLLGLIGGCSEWSWDVPVGEAETASTIPNDTPKPLSPVAVESSPSIVTEELSLSQEPIRLKISFHILRIWAKQGVFSQSNILWNYLDEEALTAEQSSHLRRNGLRVAKGRVELWPAIKELLDREMTATCSQEIVVAPPAPLEIEASLEPRDQVLFVVRPDHRLKGGDFVSSTNLLRVEYAMALDDWRSLELEVMPEIRLPLFRRPRELTASGWVYHPLEHPGAVLRELAFRMKIAPGEFLLIGPSNQAHSGYYAGSLLLCDETEEGLSESIYVITPRVERTEIRGG